MHLIELAVQNLRGFSPTARIGLRPGFLALRPPQSGGPQLGALMSSLCFNDGRGQDVSFLSPGQKSGRVGITIAGTDQGVYRLVRELGGSGALHRMDPATKQFSVVSKDATDISQFLRGQVGFPSKGQLEAIFTLREDQLPSRRPRPKPKADPAVKGPTLMSLQPTEVSDTAASQARLAELKKERELSKEVDEVQFRIDGLAAQVFELESQLKGTEGLVAALQQAEEAYQAAPTVESLGLPKDIISRAERFPQLKARLDEALARIDEERQRMEQQPAPQAVAPLTRDSRFWAGIGLGVAAIAGGLLLGGYGRYLVLLDIPAFGFAALVALKWVDDLQAASRTSRKGDVLVNREKKLRDDFDAEVAQVRQAMDRTRAETPEDLVKLLAQRGLLQEKVNELSRQLAEYQARPEYASAAQRVTELKAEQEQLNARLLEQGSYVRDVREVEREIARLEEALAKRNAPPPKSAPAAEAPRELLEDPGPAALTAAADLLTTDVPTLVSQLRERWLQYLGALTDRRYAAVEVDREGRITVVAGGKKVPAGEVPGRDLDLVYLALRFTVIEKCSATVKVPLWVDDMLTARVEEPKIPLLGRMLKHLGTQTQVLAVIAHPALASLSDAAVTL